MLASKLGADSSLVWSPEKTKLTSLPLVVVELLAEDDGRKSIQGMATCLPLPLVLELLRALEVEPEEVLPELVLPGEVLLLLPGEVLEPLLVLPGEVLEPVLLLGEVLEPLLVLPGELLAPVLAPDEFSDTIAKSIRPEAGLTIRSLIEPNCELELPFTCAPVNWLTRKSWWLMLRPVGLNAPLRLEEGLPELPDKLPELCELVSLKLPEELLEEDCAWAPRARHAAQAIMVRIICFFINCLSLVV